VKSEKYKEKAEVVGLNGRKRLKGLKIGQRGSKGFLG